MTISFSSPAPSLNSLTVPGDLRYNHERDIIPGYNLTYPSQALTPTGASRLLIASDGYNDITRWNYLRQKGFNMRVVVTGANGRLGRSVTALLQKQQIDVVEARKYK